MNNTLPLVSFEQAKILKEKGFRWDVKHFYLVHQTQGVLEEENYEGEEQDYNNSYSWHYSRPSLPLAAQWLREVKGLHVHCTVFVGNKPDMWNYIIVRLYDDHVSQFNVSDERYDTHDSAYSAGITHALKLTK